MHMTLPVPRSRYIPSKRTLDDFPDTIITRTTRNGSGAVFDCGLITEVADPDFAPYGYGPTPIEAARNCANHIRNASKKYRMLQPGYDFSYRLMPHWQRKEHALLHGIDPNDIREQTHHESAWSHWPFAHLSWLQRAYMCSHFEFYFLNLAYIQVKRQNAGLVEPQNAAEEIVEHIAAEAQSLFISNPQAITPCLDVVRERARAFLA